MKWNDKPSVQKGSIGERIVDEWLIGLGWVPYRPIADAAHPFDRLVASKDKKRIVVVEVKSKPRREAYADTGIDYRHYQDYLGIWQSYNITVFLAFVDEKQGRIYGEFLSRLNKFRIVDGNVYPWRPRPNQRPDIVYFPLEAMRQIGDLTGSQISSLSALRSTGFVGAA